MKRILLTLFLTATALLAKAQGIEGRWISEPVRTSQEKLELLAVMDVTFRSDGTFTDCGSADMPEQRLKDENAKKPFYIGMHAHVRVNGTYRISGNELTLMYDHKKAEGELDELIMRSDDPDVQKKIDSASNTIRSLMSGPVVKAIKKSYKDASGTMKDFRIDGNTMTFTDSEGQKFVLHRQ